jgi:hypothetical protein
MMPRIRRAGIVLTVLWFVGFFLWAFVNTEPAATTTLGFSLRHCYEQSDRNSMKLNASGSAYLYTHEEVEAEENACTARAEDVFMANFDTDRNAVVKLVLLIDLASIALAWLVAWIVISVGRWVIWG